MSNRLTRLFVLLGVTSIVACATTSSAAPRNNTPEDGSYNGDYPASMQPRINELNTLISKANEDINTACGCSPRVSGEWKTFADVNKLYRCHDTIDAISSSAKAYCSTPEAKKAFCGNIASFTIRFTTERYDQPKLEGKKVVTYCTDMKYTNADELKELYAPLR